MTLTEFLDALDNAQALITVKDSTEGNPVLVKFYADGYSQLLAALLAREVDKFKVANQNSIEVILKAA